MTADSSPDTRSDTNPGTNPGGASNPGESRVGVMRARGVYRVMALEDIAPGEEILTASGVTVDRPTRTSLQLGTHEHLEVSPGLGLERTLDQHPWRFLNHGCEANAAFRGRKLVALVPIRRGEDVTFNYNATEYDMRDVFACNCGAATCTREDVRGFRYLSRDAQEALRDQLAPHLLHRLDGDS